MQKMEDALLGMEADDLGEIAILVSDDKHTLPKMMFSDQLTFGGGPPGPSAAWFVSSSTSRHEVTSPRSPNGHYRRKRNETL